MKLAPAKRFQRYASVMLRWVIICAGVFVLTVGTGLYITNDVLEKVYTATATLQLPATDLATPSADSTLEPVPFQPEFQNTMMSPEFLLAIVKDLGLDKAWARRLKLEADQLPDVDALTHMEKLVKVSVRRSTNLVDVTAASDEPGEAAAIANAIAERYKSERAPATNHATTVRIVERADPPKEPTLPNKELAYDITLVVGIAASLFAASFVEMILLFIRAGERPES
jgi:capsular polysaccharide biosynthesis protein